MRARLTPVIAIAVLLGACGIVPGERPPLHVFNGTTLVVVVTVNGQVIGEFTQDRGPDIDVSGLPPLPWLVEARTTAGRLLVSMTVEPGQVGRRVLPDGTVEAWDVVERVELSCGRLSLFAGGIRPGAAGGPPPVGPVGVPGDCVP